MVLLYEFHLWAILQDDLQAYEVTLLRFKYYGVLKMSSSQVSPSLPEFMVITAGRAFIHENISLDYHMRPFGHFGGESQRD